jgi:transposase-like protein
MNPVKQSIPKELRYTVENFHKEFPDNDSCLARVMEMRFPGSMAKCDSDDCAGAIRKHHRVTGRTAYACDNCGHHMYPLAGTVFEKSTTSLRLWFYAMYLMGSTRCGISAKQIQRETGVTYKTAWRMFRQIRMLLSEDLQLEGSTVEVDETYVGGRQRGQRGRASKLDPKAKTPVVGVVSRTSGKVIARVAGDTSKPTLHGFIKEFVLPGSVVFTDDYASYDGIEGPKYRHYRIRHSEKIYVTGSRGQIHTQTIEGFWSLVKRGLGGVYHSVSKKYLQSYINEYSFRYNRRDSGNLIFFAILGKVAELASQPPVEAIPQNQIS